MTINYYIYNRYNLADAEYNSTSSTLPLKDTSITINRMYPKRFLNNNILKPLNKRDSLIWQKRAQNNFK